MALSGSISGAYKGWTVRSDWSASQSISGNYSDITVNHYLVLATYYSLSINGRSNTCTVDGTERGFSSPAINGGAGTYYLGQTSYRVYHNSDGTKSCSIRTVFNIKATLSGVYVDSIPASGTISLDKIPRYATANQSLASKTETTVTMNWSSDSVIDYIWYSTNNGSSWHGVDVADGKNGSYNITSLSAGTTYNIKTRVRRKDSQLTTDTSAISVTTYQYPYATSMPNFTIGNTLTIGLYNPLGRSVHLYMVTQSGSEIDAGNYTGTTVSGWASSYYTNALYASIPNAKSGTYKIKAVYGSNTSLKTGGTYSINTSACTPSIGSLTYQDVNSTVTAITGNNQNIVQNQSTVRYTASNLSAKNSATISSVKLAINGFTYTLAVSGSTATGGNATVNSSSNVTATATITDSRGLTATKSVTLNMLAWSVPTAITTMQRENNYYSNTTINVDANYSSVDSKNSVTITVRYKKTSDGSYGSWINFSDNVPQTFSFDNNYAWNVQVKVEDRFDTTQYNLVLDRGLPIIYFDKLNSSVGINCFPTKQKALEVGENGIWGNLTSVSVTKSANVRITAGTSVLRCGMLVVASFHFLVNPAVTSDHTTLLSGLPKPAQSGVYFICADDDGNTYLLAIGSDGTLTTSDTTTSMPYGWYAGSIMYFAEE